MSPFNVNLLQGGTQDNGTWQTPGNPVKWENTMIGDGGQSGFDAANPDFRFHTFFNATPDVNFSNGDIADWNWIADQIYFGARAPGVLRPDHLATRWCPDRCTSALAHVWRTKTHGMGAERSTSSGLAATSGSGFSQTISAATGLPLGRTTAWRTYRAGLRAPLYGADRQGGNVAAVERVTATYVDALGGHSARAACSSRSTPTPSPRAPSTFTRLDSLAASDPNRFVSGIHIDPADPNHAWISYTGFTADHSARRRATCSR